MQRSRRQLPSGVAVMEPVEYGMDFAEVVPISQAITKYLIQWGDEDSPEGIGEAEVLVVMTRAGGLLLAAPVDFFAEEQLAEGNTQQDDLMLGMSTVLKVPGMMFQDGTMVPLGVQLSVLVVDCHESICQHMKPLEMEAFYQKFSEEDQDAFPDPASLVGQAMVWLQENAGEERAGLYSPEVTAESGEGKKDTPAFKGRPKAKGKPAPRPGGATDTARPRKATTASLAASLENMNATLARLVEKQHVLEEQMKNPPNPTTAALQRPLSSHVPAQSTTVAAMARELQTPPVRRGASRLEDLAMTGLAQPPEVRSLELEKADLNSPSLAAAMMAQSTAITTLISQLAAGHTDPMAELALTGIGGSRGASGRAKLQNDLALQKGIFFESVMRSMSRRMYPTLPATMSYQEMMKQGICGTKYLERFGGYGRCRDLGVIQFQVMQCMDFLQMENMDGARDCLSLLAVMLEQASLDGGRLDLGQILTLAEDPPASIFTNRQVAQLSKARAFSALADQKWVTTALAFIKELDTITSKRVEMMSGGGVSSSGGDKTTQDGPGKGKGRKKGGGRGDKFEKTEDEVS